MHEILPIFFLTSVSLLLGEQVCNLAWSKSSNELVSTHGYSQHQVVIWKYPSMTQVATLTGVLTLAHLVIWGHWPRVCYSRHRGPENAGVLGKCYLREIRGIQQRGHTCHVTVTVLERSKVATGHNHLIWCNITWVKRCFKLLHAPHPSPKIL